MMVLRNWFCLTFCLTNSLKLCRNVSKTFHFQSFERRAALVHLVLDSSTWAPDCNASTPFPSWLCPSLPPCFAHQVLFVNAGNATNGYWSWHPRCTAWVEKNAHHGGLCWRDAIGPPPTHGPKRQQVNGPLQTWRPELLCFVSEGLARQSEQTLHTDL